MQWIMIHFIVTTPDFQIIELLKMTLIQLVVRCLQKTTKRFMETSNMCQILPVWNKTSMQLPQSALLWLHGHNKGSSVKAVLESLANILSSALEVISTPGQQIKMLLQGYSNSSLPTVYSHPQIPLQYPCPTS